MTPNEHADTHDRDWLRWRDDWQPIDRAAVLAVIVLFLVWLL